MTEQNQTLLQTKLHRPRLTRSLVIRSHLFEYLNRSLESPLTLVCAAAGFGKTTLVSSWVKGLSSEDPQQNPSTPVMWLSLDEKDSDQFLFLRYLIAAIQTNFPGKCTDTLELVHSISQPPLSLLANTLSNEIDSLPGDFILVLDDYSSIRGHVIHDFLNTLLEHWPRTMHLVLITRNDPPLPLAKLRARGELIEIRSKDLRFTHQDTVNYLNKVLPAALSESILTPLEQRIEGWIAGMQLAVLSLLNSNDPQAFLTAMTSTNTDTATYLVDEVLLQQPPAIQNFLLKTSILDSFSRSLCQVLVEDEDPEWSATACLEWVKRANLFIIPLDQKDEWCRYHHIFQELLQQRLRQEAKPDQYSSLHHKAALWYAGQGLIDDAIHHYLKADNLEQAAELIEQAMRDLLDREDRATIDRWLGLLPEDYIKSRPGLLVFRAVVSRMNADFGEKSPQLHLVETLLDEQSGMNFQSGEMQNVVRGLVKILYGREAFYSNQMDRAIQFCQEALALLPESWSFAHGRAMMFLGLSLHASGQGKAAERLLLDHYKALSDKKGIEGCCILVAQGINLLQENNLLQAANSFKAVLRQTSFEQIALLRIWALFFLAEIYYHLDDLDASRQYLAEIVDHRYFAIITFYCQALAGMALIDQTGWKTSQARDSLEQLSQFDLENRGYETFTTQSLRAHLYLIQGDHERAGQWVDEFREPVQQEPLLWIEIPHLTQVRILLIRNSTGDSQRALSILDELKEVAEQTHNRPALIQILALRSMGLNAQGNTRDAQFILEQAVQMAGQGGNIRVFVDLGKSMQDMLRRLADQGRCLDMTRRILAAFSQGGEDRHKENPTQPAYDPILNNLTLAEPLTSRELDVLALLREPLSNKEIAQKLHISYATAKRHTINIYGKLGVSGRWNAVARAVELGILPSEVYTTS